MRALCLSSFVFCCMSLLGLSGVVLYRQNDGLLVVSALSFKLPLISICFWQGPWLLSKTDQSLTNTGSSPSKSLTKIARTCVADSVPGPKQRFWSRVRVAMSTTLKLMAVITFDM